MTRYLVKLSTRKENVSKDAVVVDVFDETMQSQRRFDGAIDELE